LNIKKIPYTYSAVNLLLGE
jgi:maleylacetoacetate isomerase